MELKATTYHSLVFWAHLVELLITTYGTPGQKMSLYNHPLLQGSDDIRDYDPGAPRLNSIKSCLENIGKLPFL